MVVVSFIFVVAPMISHPLLSIYTRCLVPVAPFLLANSSLVMFSESFEPHVFVAFPVLHFSCSILTAVYIGRCSRSAYICMYRLVGLEALNKNVSSTVGQTKIAIETKKQKKEHN